jgi:hypothetical protein
VGSHVAVHFSVREKAKVTKVKDFDLCIIKHTFSLRNTAALKLLIPPLHCENILGIQPTTVQEEYVVTACLCEGKHMMSLERTPFMLYAVL